MVIRLTSLACFIPVLLTGCASVAKVERSEEPVTMHEAVPDPVLQESIHNPLSVKPCQRTERDLTVDWQAKRYLCSHEDRRVALQQVNDGEFVAYLTQNKPLAKKATLKPSAFLIPAVATVTEPVQTSVESIRLSSVESPRVQTTIPDETQIFRVWFPKNHEVLGQQGMEKVLAMVPAITDARRVSLLGVYEADEIAQAMDAVFERERFSVGRALSVKDVWGRAGVALSKVKILHHQDSLAGRYVAVTVYD